MKRCCLSPKSRRENKTIVRNYSFELNPQTTSAIGDRGFHVQLRRGTTADLDAAAAGESAGLDFSRDGVTKMGDGRRKKDTRIDLASNGRNQIAVIPRLNI